MTNKTLTETAETLGGLGYYLARYEELIADRMQPTLDAIKQIDRFIGNKKIPNKSKQTARQEKNKLERYIAPDKNAMKGIELLITHMEQSFTGDHAGDDKERMELALHKMSSNISQLIEIILKNGIEHKMQSAILIKVDKFEAGKTIISNKKNYKVITARD